MMHNSCHILYQQLVSWDITGGRMEIENDRVHPAEREMPKFNFREMEQRK